jgi:hypothetical protein
MTESTIVQTEYDLVGLFDILTSHGLERVVVTFHGGWDSNEQDGITAFKEGKEVDSAEVMLEENVKSLGEEQCEKDYDDLFGRHPGDRGLFGVWSELARHMSEGDYDDDYDRYDAGTYYSGVDYGEVIFDVAKCEIRLEAKAKVRVVEYREDPISRVWAVDEYGQMKELA